MSRPDQPEETSGFQEPLPSAAVIPPGGITTFCFFWLIGGGLGVMVESPWPPALASMAVAALILLTTRRRARISEEPASWSSPSQIALALAIVLSAAAWHSAHTQRLSGDHVALEIAESPRAVRVIGRLDGPRSHRAAAGEWTPTYQPPPITLGRIDLQAIDTGEGFRPASGSLQLRIKQEHHRLEHGMRVEAVGWLEPIDPPDSPGQVDFRRLLRQRGIHGRFVAETRGAVQILDDPDPVGALRQARHRFSQRCRDSLLLGLDAQARSSEFLVAVLLGQSLASRPELYDEFRRVGLAHILAISGAHLGILLGLIWLLVRLTVDRPPRAAMIVLLALLLYLVAVPWRTPILRAGLMGGLVCIGLAMGRRISSLDMISLAALIILIHDPVSIINPGFQLSFGIVFALLLFTGRVSRWMYADPLFSDSPGSFRLRFKRRSADFLAANVVAWTVSLPIIAYHFQIINPLTIPLMVPAFFLLSAALALGFVKLIIGLVLPSAGMLLAHPLALLGDGMLFLTGSAAEWRWSMIELPLPPSNAWVFFTLAIIAALFAGRLRRARYAVVAFGLSISWLAFAQQPYSMLPVEPDEKPLLRLYQVPLGERNATLIRITDDSGRATTFLVNPGSIWQSHSGYRTLHPILMRLGVRNIDHMIVTEPRLGNFNAALDLAEHRYVGRFIVPAGFFEVEGVSPNTARALERLAEGLAHQGVPTVEVAGHHRLSVDDFEITLLSGDPGGSAAQESGLIITIAHHDRGLLVLAPGLNTRSARWWLEADHVPPLPVDAHLVDLPGRLDDQRSDQWLDRWRPGIVLGAATADRPPSMLENNEGDRPTDRLWLDSTAKGMIELHYMDSGRWRWAAYRHRNSKSDPAEPVRP
ncbi:MAG: ComEC/Rec2 family competence protein [Phycisphaeraceae bacterium]|nr:ComEC/Rec2 family competence protein [Phycisphaeraceae bacterium]